MSTVQIVGIAVASAVVVLLIVALVVSRRRGERDEPSSARAGSSSFLDDAPQDTLAKLGRAERPVEDVTVDPGVQRQQQAMAADRWPRPAGEEAEPGSLDLDWGPAGSDATIAPAATSEPPASAPTPAPSVVTVPTSPVTESGATTAPEPAGAALGEPAVAPAAEESGSSGTMVPLSDIIVTTSDKLVDLQDAEVRRMLTDLVKFEIDQATQYRQQGQTIDAVLQLTEAEKISRALGMQESAEAIRTMMADLQGRT